MMAATYPVGYATQRVSMAELKRRYEPHMHPAMARRIFPWVESMGGLVGIKDVPGCGGGRRTVQPIKPGFAPPGKSFHQDQRFASGIVAYSAWDLVVGTSGVHRSPTWAETATAPEYGLHTFISGEPWHIQCIEIRGWGTWDRNGRPDPAMDFPLPGTPPPPPQIPDGALQYNPPTDWWWFPLDTNKPTLREGAQDAQFLGHVRYAQDAIFFGAGGGIARDGSFGPQMAQRVRDLQTVFDIGVDGGVGPQTWGVIDLIVAGLVRPADPPTAPDIEQVSPCRYWVRPGDSPWAAGVRVYGSGHAGAEALAASLFAAPNVRIDIPTIKGVKTTVKAGEGPYAILARVGAPASALPAFYDWNGGEQRSLHPGDVVYMPLTG